MQIQLGNRQNALHPLSRTAAGIKLPMTPLRSDRPIRIIFGQSKSFAYRCSCDKLSGDQIIFNAFLGTMGEPTIGSSFMSAFTIRGAQKNLFYSGLAQRELRVNSSKPSFSTGGKSVFCTCERVGTWKSEVETTTGFEPQKAPSPLEHAFNHHQWSRSITECARPGLPDYAIFGWAQPPFNDHLAENITKDAAKDSCFILTIPSYTCLRTPVPPFGGSNKALVESIAF
ncbi:13740_t:CDS:2 [Acaulospora morrowiae]|uniref:13740_t:CDS:1 n=1 Tax=Acaulospora morrowiae TaxID=94023 RepID=A0A9N8VXQ6_9GLOM|nr:13740_t:CDS:2 [Acaulospora morrowiae]